MAKLLALPIRVVMFALCLAKVGFAQSENQLLGQWHCTTRETVKVHTGKIIGGSVGENTLEFRNDQTALVTGVAESGKTILRVNGRWSRGPKKLALQVEGEPDFTGSINKAGLLILQGNLLDRDREIVRVVEWTCNKRLPALNR